MDRRLGQWGRWERTVAVGGDRGHFHQPRSRGDRGWCPGGTDKGECCVVSRPGRPVTLRCRGGV